MRLIQTRVGDEIEAEVMAVLEEENIEHIAAAERDESDAIILYFPLPDGAVEKVMDRLYDAGLDEDAFTIITDIQSATTPTFDELESQYTQGPDDEVGLSHATLRANAREVTPGRAMFVTFAALSAIVASAGLMLDSAIVIVGAMVISPFAGSALSASVGAVIGDYPSILDSIKSQLLGLVVAVSAATGAAAVFRWGYLVPPNLAIQNISQVSAFSIPIVLTYVIAIFAGAAGALALATDLDVSLAGVAVAAAIVPAAAAVGIGVVWQELTVIFGALVLLLMNLLLINLSAYVSLTLFGYRASPSASLASHVNVDARTAVYAVVGAVVLVALLGAIVSTYQYLAFVETTNHNVEDVLTQPRYDELELIDVQTDYGAQLVRKGDSDTVSIVVGRTSDREYASLSATLQRAIAEDTPRAVTVEVQFTDYQRTEPTTQTRSSLVARPDGGV
ncbi:TIGR00341 family protein [Halomicroarcula limicola]|uniref:TIGR00341 family protein n=1 Tax=Haloarcula limicola TaxID=1429915 RepID=A0A8J8C558_9EURY|nr:TIGR00341 family protein [Halomicroarcula limicola]MBV0924884.1 TIGR00341 family protein [Halomicroarcula limicola]